MEYRKRKRSFRGKKQQNIKGVLLEANQPLESDIASDTLVNHIVRLVSEDSQ